MTIEEIKENPEKALELIAAGSKNVERIKQLESINSDLVDQKKTLKQELKDGSSDEALKLELDNYKSQVETIGKDKADQEKTFNTELNTLRANSMLKELGIKGVNDVSTDAIIKNILEGGEFKDGEMVYLNEDGTTKFNESTRSPLSMLDRVNDLKEANGSLFELPKGGGGGGGDDTSHAQKTSVNDVINANLKY